MLSGDLSGSPLTRASDLKSMAEEKKTLKFVRDSAADTDFFGTHSRLARTIAHVICENPNLKVIGLLGPWGSGKSTVIRQIERELEQHCDETTTHVFTYDAWVHQSDSPRRSFLEAFVAFLADLNLVKAHDFQTKLDALTRHTETTETKSVPKVRASGVLFFFSLLVAAYASQFVKAEKIGPFLAGTGVASDNHLIYWGVAGMFVPLAAAGAIYMAWRPWNKASLLSRKFWTENAEKNRDDSLLGLFTNKVVTQQHNQVVRTPEPTAIEFQHIFQELLSFDAQYPVRLVIAIDNLDRLPGEEAKRMWTTIRSFFLGKNQHGRVATRLPTVLLPVADEAFRALFPSDDTALSANARSFMDKTFDITFRVPPPVLSDWRDYLTDRMKVVFGDDVDREWIYQLGRYVEALAASGAPIMPRTINVLVNSVGALWLERGNEDISFASIAFYAALKPEISASNPLSFPNPIGGIDEIDPDWQSAIAALHFGVPKSKGLQLLLGPALSKAIWDKDDVAFTGYAAIHGFESVLIDAIHKARDTAVHVPIHAILMFAKLGYKDEPWVAAVWRGLRRQFTSSQWSAHPGLPDAAVTLLSNLPTHVRAQYLSEVCQCLQTLMALDQSDQPELSAPAAVLKALKEQIKNENLQYPALSTGPDPKRFLLLARTFTQRYEVSEFLSSAATEDELTTELQASIRGLPFKDFYFTLKGARLSQARFSARQLVGAVPNAMKPDQSAELAWFFDAVKLGSTYLNTIFTLCLFRKEVPKALTIAKRYADSAVIQRYFNTSDSSKGKIKVSPEELALIVVFAMIMQDTAVSAIDWSKLVPNGGSKFTTSLYEMMATLDVDPNTIQNFIDKNPTLVPTLLDGLRLWLLAKAHNNSAKLT